MTYFQRKTPRARYCTEVSRPLIPGSPAHLAQLDREPRRSSPPPQKPAPVRSAVVR